jgi:hypothetical protein
MFDIDVLNLFSSYSNEEYDLNAILSKIRPSNKYNTIFYVDAKLYGDTFFGFLCYDRQIIHSFNLKTKKSDEAEKITLSSYYSAIRSKFKRFNIFADSMNAIRLIDDERVCHVPRKRNPLNVLMPFQLKIT